MRKVCSTIPTTITINVRLWVAFCQDQMLHHLKDTTDQININEHRVFGIMKSIRFFIRISSINFELGSLLYIQLFPHKSSETSILWYESLSTETELWQQASRIATAQYTQPWSTFRDHDMRYPNNSNTKVRRRKALLCTHVTLIVDKIMMHQDQACKELRVFTLNPISDNKTEKKVSSFRSNFCHKNSVFAQRKQCALSTICGAYLVTEGDGE